MDAIERLEHMHTDGTTDRHVFFNPETEYYEVWGEECLYTAAGYEAALKLAAKS
ncbi:MAG: hypothetical protein P4L84_34950 [Isosphaeraceae bacterium]|nr:hypothetical protein [Isosphaeraceae bacterium]